MPGRRCSILSLRILSTGLSSRYNDDSDSIDAIHCVSEVNEDFMVWSTAEGNLGSLAIIIMLAVVLALVLIGLRVCVWKKMFHSQSRDHALPRECFAFRMWDDIQRCMLFCLPLVEAQAVHCQLSFFIWEDRGRCKPLSSQYQNP